MKIILCNCPPTHAADIARSVVEKRLAACVNLISGVRSIYRWQGETCDEHEDTLLIKTGADTVEALCELLDEIHPYDVPEILVLGIDEAASSSKYVSWVNQVTGN